MPVSHDFDIIRLDRAAADPRSATAPVVDANRRNSGPKR